LAPNLQNLCGKAQVQIGRDWCLTHALRGNNFQGGGQSIQQQGGRQTAHLAGSKTGRHEPAASAADEAPKSPNRRGKKKQKVIIHPTSVTTLLQIRALSVLAVLDGYQCAAETIFQRTAPAEPDLPSADCDPVPSLVESSDSESDVDEDEDPQKQRQIESATLDSLVRLVVENSTRGITSTARHCKILRNLSTPKPGFLVSRQM